MCGSKPGFVLPETDAVVFFAAESNFKTLNNTNYKEAVQCLVDHLFEVLWFENGIAGNSFILQQ